MSLKQASLGERFDWWRNKAVAITWLVLGQRGRAEAIFDAMLVRWPDDPYALASRAHVRAQAGRDADALADALALVRTHTGATAANWFNAAFLLEQAGRIDEAEAAFRKALDLDPRLDRAWYGLGLVLIRQHRFDDAVAALKRNTALQPMSPYGWYQLARVHVDRQDPEAARKIIRHLKKFEPKFADQLVRETGLVP